MPRLKGETIEEKLVLNSVEDPPSGCLRWTGAHIPSGYGQVYVGGRVVGVHRVAHELWIGPIPEGLTIDHVRERGCLFRDCINPAHLEAVEMAENLRRVKKRLTMCGKGHPFSGPNLYLDPRGRQHCRECIRERERRRTYPKKVIV